MAAAAASAAAAMAVLFAWRQTVSSHKRQRERRLAAPLSVQQNTHIHTQYTLALYDHHDCKNTEPRAHKTRPHLSVSVCVCVWHNIDRTHTGTHSFDQNLIYI